MRRFLFLGALLVASVLMSGSTFGANAVVPGDLIKGSGAAIYYQSDDGKRYLFPNEETYLTWYDDFSRVKIIRDTDLARIHVGGDVTPKPGTLVKTPASPKVYVVTAYRRISWLESGAIAGALFGPLWRSQVLEISGSSLEDFRIASTIKHVSQYSESIRSRVGTIEEALVSNRRGTANIKLTGIIQESGTFPITQCPPFFWNEWVMSLSVPFNEYELGFTEEPTMPEEGLLQTLELEIPGVGLRSPDGDWYFAPWSDTTSIVKGTSSAVLQATFNAGAEQEVRLWARLEC